MRGRAQEMLAAGLAGKLSAFTLDMQALPACADFVTDVIRANYPSLQVPFHARWRHFAFGGRDLWQDMRGRAGWKSLAEMARAAFDLAITSVLLDAGAGMAWRYYDSATGMTASRSEGLALASLRMFAAGRFSAMDRWPLRADAAALKRVDAERIANAFQASKTNPLAGLDGRAALIRRLGETVAADEDAFALRDNPRPGGLYDYLAGQTEEGKLPAAAILEALLTRLGPIWPSRLTVEGISLGDTWKHEAIKRDDATDGLIPFHKLSQWLAYSLIEPLQWAGLTVTGVDGLTGLAEYRNGGLFIDLEVILPRDTALLKASHAVDSAAVIEWRALTIALLDEIAPLVRARLGVSADAFPLACVLEGGTWQAGRKAAQARRADGGPPLAVISDGTVF